MIQKKREMHSRLTKVVLDFQVKLFNLGRNPKHTRERTRKSLYGNLIGLLEGLAAGQGRRRKFINIMCHDPCCRIQRHL